MSDGKRLGLRLIGAVKEERLKNIEFKDEIKKNLLNYG